MEGRRERKKEETRRHIISVGMKLIYEYGFDSVSMEQIASTADVAKGTLYNYFPVKEAVVAGYFRQCSVDMRAHVEELAVGEMPVKEKLKKLYYVVADWQVSHKDILAIYLSYRLQNITNGSMEPENRSGFHQNLQKVMQAGIENGELRGDFSSEELVDYMESFYRNVIMRWLKNDGDDLYAELDRMIELFLSGASDV
ncbi:MAG: TetR/AcrR family transcriptional regulator [Deferribacterales bacterium]